MSKATVGETAQLIKAMERFRTKHEMTWGSVAEELEVSLSSLNNWRTGVSCPGGKNWERASKWLGKPARAAKAKKKKKKKTSSKPAEKLERALVDRGALKTYTVVLRTETGKSGVLPSQQGLLKILGDAGLYAVVEEGIPMPPDPLRDMLAREVQGIVRLEMANVYGRLANGNL